MLLHIDHYLQVGDVKEKFNDWFPHLKLEFYKDHHEFKSNLAAEDYLIIGDLTKSGECGEIDIKSRDKCEKLVHEFKEDYHLLMKVFCMHNNKWQMLALEDKLAPEYVRSGAW